MLFSRLKKGSSFRKKTGCVYNLFEILNSLFLVHLINLKVQYLYAYFKRICVVVSAWSIVDNTSIQICDNNVIVY